MFLGFKDRYTLSVYNKREPALCRFCRVEFETHEHLVFSCPAFHKLRKKDLPPTWNSLIKNFENEHMRFAMVTIMSSWNNETDEALRVAEEMLNFR